MFRIFIAFIFIFNLSGCGYNDIQTYDEQVNASWSEVLNQYQRRTDLIPNLVASIKGYSSHEQEVLEAVTLARSQANRASSDLQKTPGDEQKLQAWQQAQAQVTRTLGQLTIISERYPQLKAQELYQNLMVQSSKEVKIELPLREEDILKPLNNIMSLSANSPLY